MTNLDKPATKKSLLRLAEEELLSPATLERSFAIAEIQPDKNAWNQFANRALLILGAVLSISGIFFFFAYNWQAIHHFFKFGIIGAILLSLVIFVHRRGLEDYPGKIALTAASFIVGAFLAVYGQAYQTGADSYRLFLAWSILILGWTWISKFSPSWFLFYFLMQLSLYFYWDQIWHVTEIAVFYTFFGFNLLALMIWEVAHRRISWLQNRWMPRVIVLPLFFSLLLPTWYAIYGYYYWREPDAPWGTILSFSPLIFLIFTVIILYLYTTRFRDLFTLAIACFSLISVIMSYLFDAFDIWDAWFIQGLILVGLTAAAVRWLRHISTSWEAANEYA